MIKSKFNTQRMRKALFVACFFIMGFSITRAIITRVELNEAEVKIMELEKIVKNLEEESQNYFDYLDTIERAYENIENENQVFSSMLAEIENEPGGHEILSKLFHDKAKKDLIDPEIRN